MNTNHPSPQDPEKKPSTVSPFAQKMAAIRGETPTSRMQSNLGSRPPVPSFSNTRSPLVSRNRQEKKVLKKSIDDVSPKVLAALRIQLKYASTDEKVREQFMKSLPGYTPELILEWLEHNPEENWLENRSGQRRSFTEVFENIKGTISVEEEESEKTQVVEEVKEEFQQKIADGVSLGGINKTSRNFNIGDLDDALDAVDISETKKIVIEFSDLSEHEQKAYKDLQDYGAGLLEQLPHMSFEQKLPLYQMFFSPARCDLNENSKLSSEAPVNFYRFQQFLLDNQEDNILTIYLAISEDLNLTKISKRNENKHLLDLKTNKEGGKNADTTPLYMNNTDYVEWLRKTNRDASIDSKATSYLPPDMQVGSKVSGPVSIKRSTAGSATAVIFNEATKDLDSTEDEDMSFPPLSNSMQHFVKTELLELPPVPQNPQELIHVGEAICAYVFAEGKDNKWTWKPFWETPYRLGEPLKEGAYLGAPSVSDENLQFPFRVKEVGKVVPLPSLLKSSHPHTTHCVEVVTTTGKKSVLVPAIAPGSMLEIMGKDAQGRNIRTMTTIEYPLIEGGPFMPMKEYYQGYIKNLKFDGLKNHWVVQVVRLEKKQGKTSEAILDLTLKLPENKTRTRFFENLNTDLPRTRTVGTQFQQYDKKDIKFLGQNELLDFFCLSETSVEIYHGHPVTIDWQFTPRIHNSLSGVQQVAAISRALPEHNPDLSEKDLPSGYALYLFENRGNRWHVLDKESGKALAINKNMQEILDKNLPTASSVPLAKFKELFETKGALVDRKEVRVPVDFERIDCQYQFQDEKWATFQKKMIEGTELFRALGDMEWRHIHRAGIESQYCPINHQVPEKTFKILEKFVKPETLRGPLKDAFETIKNVTHAAKTDTGTMADAYPRAWTLLLNTIWKEQVSTLFDQDITPSSGRFQKIPIQVPSAASDVKVSIATKQSTHQNTVERAGSNYWTSKGVLRSERQNSTGLQVKMENTQGDTITFELTKTRTGIAHLSDCFTTSAKLIDGNTGQPVPLLPEFYTNIIATPSLGIEGLPPIMLEYLNGQLENKALQGGAFRQGAPFSKLIRVLEHVAKSE